MKTLDISPELKLPLDAATETFGILAKKGAGKSNAAVVMAEQMFDAGIPWVAIDPKGDWWGVRSSQDGESAGLPLPVFGGRHADVPLEPTAGPMLADLILSERLTCVLDVSEFSKSETVKFLTAFADRLYRQAEDEPLHLFLEEAHEYLPQRVMGEDAKMVGAWQKIVKQGRFKGIGVTLITQRSASLNKDVLTQVDTLITLRTTSPQDRAAIKGWVDIHVGGADMLDSLPTLANGEAWFWHPEGNLLPMGFQLVKLKFHRRRTFDSGATPKVGQPRRAPATLADVDLDVIRRQMSDTIEKAKASDPRVLQARIKELERELAKNVVERVVEVEVEKIVEVPPKGLGDIIKKIELLSAEVERHSNWSAEMTLTFGELLGDLAEMIERGRSQVSTPAVRQRATAAPKSKPDSRPPVERPRPYVAPQPRSESENGEVKITGGALRMLQALGYMAMPLNRVQLGLHAGMKSTSGTFSNYLSTLRTAGLIEDAPDRKVQLTEAGAEYLGPEAYKWKPDPEELREMWRGKLTGGARRMFDELVAVYPASLTRDELGQRAEMAKSGTFSNYLAKLRTNELITVNGQEVAASGELF